MNRILFSAILLAVLAGCGQPAPPAKAPIISSSPMMDTTAGATEPKVKLETLAHKKDFVCDMDLEAEVAFTAKYEEKSYGFCSVYCREEFKKDPARYLAKLNAAAK